MVNILRTLAICALGGLLAGCDTLSYYMQAFRGQAELWYATRPIKDVLADQSAPAQLKERLANANRIREFASSELALPRNGSYHGYADLKRPFVVWNLFATDPFSVKPRQWCYPIAGCVAYRGYFARAEAEAAAAALKRKGDEVYLGGVPAYSTLGYFNDPLLNTFIHYPQAELARLIFHELAHQVAYAQGDTTFNESFAVAVEREGVRRWLAAHGTPEELEAYRRAQERRAAFQALAIEYRGRLEALYALDMPRAEMAERKREIFRELAGKYEALKQSWGGFAGYDPWLGANANNASLAAVSVYTHLVPAFQALLKSVDYDMPTFYARVRALARLPQAERHARLEELRPRAVASETVTAE